MRRPSLLPTIGLFTLTGILVILTIPATAESRWPFAGDRTIRLDVAGGSLEIELRPDRGRALSLTPDGPHRWTFRGATTALVGESYTILLRNRTPERLKVVVGVDGLNLYRRRPIVGRSDGDIGSILSPWSERSLPGWQLDQSRAQRFVFSPPEWSEGQGRTDSQIGLVSVEVYEEELWRSRHDHHRDDKSSELERRSSQEALRAAPEPQIGTTSGEDVSSHVRTVRFRARTVYPSAWAEIDYGKADQRPIPRPRFQHLLGLEVEAALDGVRVMRVSRGSEADRAGIEPSDLIVRIDTETKPSPDIFRRVLRRKGVGDYVFLRVRRGDHELALKIRT